MRAIQNKKGKMRMETQKICCGRETCAHDGTGGTGRKQCGCNCTTDGVQKTDDRIPETGSSPIYEILLFEHPDKAHIFSDGRRDPYFPDMGCTAGMGFYHEKEWAVRAMHENMCDIRETVYNAGFVLERHPGLYQPVGREGRIYFLWDEGKKGFFEAEEPEIFRHLAL